MKTIPYVCPKCRDTEDYYGILAFPDAQGLTTIPMCPNHKDPVTGEQYDVACVCVCHGGPHE